MAKYLNLLHKGGNQMIKRNRFIFCLISIVSLLILVALYVPRSPKLTTNNQPELAPHPVDVLLAESLQEWKIEQQKFAKFFSGYLRLKWKIVQAVYINQGFSFRYHTFRLIERESKIGKELRILIGLDFIEESGKKRWIKLKKEWPSGRDVSKDNFEETIGEMIRVMLYCLAIPPSSHI